MNGRLRVGILDSGVGGGAARHVVLGRSFRAAEGGAVVSDASAGDDLGHGSELADIILAQAPEIAILDGRIFHDRLITQPAAVAAGLDWLVVEGARIVNMSFGLRHDRAVLREACARATAAGVILIAAWPARGAGVYPGAYPDVIRASGDARCAPGEISAIGGTQADFAGHPRPIRGPEGKSGGASFGTAHVSGAVAAFVARERDADLAAVRAHLAAIARYRGPERRTADVRPGQP